MLLMKAEGLNREQLNQPLPTSSLTIAGLLEHLACVEDSWIQKVFLGRPLPEPWTSAPFDLDEDWAFHSAADDAPNALRELYEFACARARAGIQGTSLDAVSVGPSRSGRQFSLRWILVHMIEETARHC
ncbi:MAG: DinB family protein [Microbacteriaceae bacterium]|nr:DinB family protein [Microbacteriaceae bacterium]